MYIFFIGIFVLIKILTCIFIKKKGLYVKLLYSQILNAEYLWIYRSIEYDGFVLQEYLEDLTKYELTFKNILYINSITIIICS